MSDDEPFRRALEFAALLAVSAGADPSAPTPSPALRSLGRRRPPWPKKHLAAVREALEEDPEFRRYAAERASMELVGEVGLAWLRGMLVEDPRLIRRLDAATDEVRQATARADVLVEQVRRLEQELQVARRDHEELQQRLFQVTRERDDALSAAAAASADVASARQLADDLRARLRQMTAEMAEARRVRDRALDERAVLEAEADAKLAEAQRLAASKAGSGRGPTLPGRRPIAVPGGLVEDSLAMATHLLAVHSVQVIVDGYNVAKQGWPQGELVEQRRWLLDRLDALVARTGVALRVVFDAADGPGLAVGADTYRSYLVEYAHDTSADDAIVEIVERTPASRPVVVVTADQELTSRVKRLGANPLATRHFLEVLLR